MAEPFQRGILRGELAAAMRELRSAA